MFNSSDLIAAIWTGKQFELREMKIHQNNSTIIRVLGSRVCGTVRHLMTLPDAQDSSFGHEIVGEIVRISEHLQVVNKQPIQVGDKVLITPSLSSIESIMSDTNAQYDGRLPQSHGFAKYNKARYFPVGGFASYIELGDNASVIKLADDVSVNKALLLEPLAVAIKAVERGIGGAKQEYECGAGIGMTAAVIGLGSIGSMVAFVLKNMAADIVGIDINPWKSQKVHAAFAIPTITIPDQDVATAKVAIQQQCHASFDLVIDCTGSPSSLELAIHLAKHGGRIIEVGSFVPGTTSYINPADICKKELEIYGSALPSLLTYPKAQHLLKKISAATQEHVDFHTVSLNKINELFPILQNNQFMNIHINPMTI